MNANKNRQAISIHLTSIILLILGFGSQASSQFHQENNNSYFFVKVLEYYSTAISKLEPSRAKGLYYVQDTFAAQMQPLATIHGKTSGTRHHRLDNQFEEISKEALKLGLNSIRVDSSAINGIECEYWISLYRMNFDQIQINESIVGNNHLCVLGKFDDQNKLGKSFRINGREVQLMPYEYVQRKIAIGKRGSVDLNGSRLELVGGENGGELFINASSKPFFNASLNLNIGASFGALGMLVSIPLNSKNNKKVNGIERNFSHFLYNIYNEKIVIAKTRDSMIAAKKKEWREKKAAEEAKKKANKKKKG